MSTLVQDILENNASIDQAFTIFRKTNLAAVRPWVYVQGVPDGQIRLQVLQGATVLSSRTLDCSDIVAAKQENFVHGWLRFDFDSLQLNIPEDNTEQEYILRLGMLNHTNDASNFIAWNREWDFTKYDNYGDVDIDGNPINDMIAPFGFELYFWESK